MSTLEIILVVVGITGLAIWAIILFVKGRKRKNKEVEDKEEEE